MVAAAAWAPPAAAEPWASLTNTAFQQLGVPEGLPNLVTFSVAQDPEGFLWFGTGDGLGRWDGYRFRVFRPDPRVPGSLPDNFIQVLHTDPSGRLWVGTAAGGLVRYDSAGENFQAYPIQGRTTARIEIRALCDGAAGDLWVGGAGGLYHLDAGATTLRHVDSPVSGAPNALGSDRVLTLLKDRAGAIWFGTGRGLYRQTGKPARFVAVKLADKKLAVAALKQDSSGTLWAGTNGSGVFRIAADGSTIMQVMQAGASPQPAVQSLDVESMAEARPSEMWLGTSGDGIVAVNEITLATRSIRHDAARPSSLAEDAVWDLFKDRQGILWAGTGHGLSWTRPDSTGIETVFSAPGTPNAISDPDVSQTLVAPDGKVWLGLLHDGVNLIDPAAGIITHIPPRPDYPLAIVDSLADGPCPPGTGGMFIGTWRGLFHADAAGGHLTRVLMADPLPERAVNALARDGTTLWIGDNGGLDRLALDAGPGPEPAVRHAVSGAALTDSRVRVLLPTGTGTIWIGTFDGVNLVDPVTGRVTQARHDPADPTSMAPGLVTSLALDRRGRLWASTTGGLCVLTNTAADIRLRFQCLGTADGLPNASVDKVLLATDGTIWASTDDGLARINPDTLHITAFHEADGLAIPAYWAGSGAVTSEGALLFGGPGGLTIVHPDRLAPASTAARVAISDLRVGRNAVPAASFNRGGKPSPLRIDAHENSLSVEFSALDYANPARVRYEYRLEGFDPGWVATDPSRRLASYNNLPPGDFTLQMRASSTIGSWAGATLSLPIRVLPAWYQTLWCRMAASLLTIGSIVLVVRRQTNRLRQRQHDLEQLVAQRTAQLSATNRDLAHVAAILSDLGVIGQQITANLDIDTVFAVMHEHIVSLLDVPHFAIYLMQKPAGVPVLRFGRRHGHVLHGSDPAVVAHRRHVVRATAAQCDVVVAMQPGGAPGLICAPLVVMERVIGAILIEAPGVSAYGDRERLIFRTLCAYGAIAIGNAETLAALADMRAELEHLAYTDGLTNLPNRRIYMDRFDSFCAGPHANDAHFALLLIDIDHFKQVNDAFGHDAGDALLCWAARLLLDSARESDIVMRLGGDEFAILLAGTQAADAVSHVCDRIVTAFAAGMMFNGTFIATSVSIGAALYPLDGTTQENIHKAADLALYEAKRCGRNTWRRFTPAQGEGPQLVKMQAH